MGAVGPVRSGSARTADALCLVVVVAAVVMAAKMVVVLALGVRLEERVGVTTPATDWAACVCVLELCSKHD